MRHTHVFTAPHGAFLRFALVLSAAPSLALAAECPRPPTGWTNGNDSCPTLHLPLEVAGAESICSDANVALLKAAASQVVAVLTDDATTDAAALDSTSTLIIEVTGIADQTPLTPQALKVLGCYKPPQAFKGECRATVTHAQRYRALLRADEAAAVLRASLAGQPVEVRTQVIVEDLLDATNGSRLPTKAEPAEASTASNKAGVRLRLTYGGPRNPVVDGKAGPQGPPGPPGPPGAPGASLSSIIALQVPMAPPPSVGSIGGLSTEPVASPRAASVPSFGFATGSGQAGSGIAMTVPLLKRERRVQLGLTTGSVRSSWAGGVTQASWTPAVTPDIEPGDAMAMLDNEPPQPARGASVTVAPPKLSAAGSTLELQQPEDRRRALALSNPCADLALLIPNRVPSELAGASAGIRLRYQFPRPIKGSSSEGQAPQTGTSPTSCGKSWVSQGQEQALAGVQAALDTLRGQAAKLSGAVADRLSTVADTCESELKSLASSVTTPKAEGGPSCTLALAHARDDVAAYLATPSAAGLPPQVRQQILGDLNGAIQRLQSAETVIDSIRDQFLAMKRSDDNYRGLIVRGDATGRPQSVEGSPISGSFGGAFAVGYRPIDKRLLLRGEARAGLTEQLEGARSGFDELLVRASGAAGWSSVDEALFNRRWLFGVDGGYGWDDQPDARIGVHASARVALGAANFVSLSARQAIIEDGNVTDFRGETTVSAEWNILPALMGWTDSTKP